MRLFTLSSPFLVLLVLLFISSAAESVPLSNSTLYPQAPTPPVSAVKRETGRGHRRLKNDDWHIRPWAIYHGRPIHT